MDASQIAPWVAAGILGFLQPFVQELFSRGKVTGRPAVWLTLAVSFVVGGLAVWLTGGLALVHVPAFTLLDPSPLFFFVLDQSAKIALVARITYAVPGIGATSATVAEGPRGGLTVASAGTPGLVQKVAGTTGAVAGPATTTPTA